MLLLGCQRFGGEPELLAVADVAPRQIELGDRLEIVGDGFPEGRPATVELSGELHRVGDLRVRRFRQVLEAKSVGRNTVVLVPTEQQLSEWVGTGEAAAHATFRGELRLAFSSHLTRTGPVFGTLKGVVIDVFPWTVSSKVAGSRVEQAERFAQFLGVVFAANGFEVALVKPGSRAERAGLRGGDVLMSLDGVRLLAKGDFFAAGAEPTALVELRRGRLQEPIPVYVDVAGFQPISPTRLSNAALLVGFAAALVLLFSAPVVRVLGWAERRVVQRLLERRPRTRPQRVDHGRQTLADVLLSRDLLPRGVLGALMRPIPYLVFLGASAVLALLAAGRVLIGPDLDLPSLFFASVVALMATSFIFGGFPVRGGWSLRAGLRAACAALVFQIPAVLALSCVFVQEGSLRATDVVESQGLLPWGYNAFASPMMFVALLVLLATAVPETSRRSFGVASLETTHQVRAVTHPVSRSLLFFAEMSHVFVVSSLAAVLFLGGWSLSPLVADSDLAGTGRLLLGVGLLQLKTLLLVFAIAGARWALSRIGQRELIGLWWRWLLPLSVGALLLSIAYRRSLTRFTLMQEAQAGVSLVVFCLVISLAGYFAVRVARASRAGSIKLSMYSLNPWL